MRTRIEYVWLNGTSWILPSFLFIWCCVSVWVGYVWFQSGETLGIVACYAMGIPGTYFLVALLFNRTDISVTEETIELVHHPMPWIGDLELNIQEIECIRWESVYHAEEGTSYRFFFCLENGKRLRAFSGVPITNPEPALKVMRRIQGVLAPIRGVDIVNE